ncbi:glycosyltransferase [Amaricoccus sp.]|uniref:glycosyltransferase n=1 Tax=Amaricoccus sp. TaxID=1872485 RepID=UPI001B7B18B7|nr:glycosyltransferase [Amaricoccus sp.]MBP7003015.1 polysaccharide pyruvyl transferase family protein [Amaricoccus sp.]
MAAPIRNVVLFYGHVASNMGDLAINLGAVALLRRAFPDARITVVQMNAARADLRARSVAAYGTPADAAAAARLVGFQPDPAQASRYALDPGALLDTVGAADSDLVVLTAGEHLFRYAGAENEAALFWRLLPAFAARARGVRCVLLPSTIGPIETSEAADLVGAAFATGLAAAVREPRSAALLAAAVPGAAVVQGLDPAFFLDPPSASPAPAPARQGRRIALVLRSEGWGIRLPHAARRAMTDAFKADGYRSSRAFRFAVAFAARALAAGDELRLIVQTEADRALVDAIRDHLRDAPGAERIEAVTPPTIETYLATLADCDVVVAARFHGLVMGLVARRPVLGLWFGAHGHKIPGLLDLLGRPDLALDLGREEPEAAAAIVSARLATAAAGLEAMEARLAELRAATLSWLGAETARPTPAAGLALDAVRPLGRLGVALAEGALARRHEATEAAEHEERRKAEAARDAAEAALRDAETRSREALARAAAEAAALREADARSRETLARATAEAAALREAGARAEREHRQRAQRAARVSEALSLRLKDMETSESWRIGHGLVRMLTAPKRMLSGKPVRRGGDADAILPEQARGRAKAPPRTPPLPLHDLLRILNQAGPPGVIAALRAELSADPAALCSALTRSARALAEAGAVEAEYPLIAETVRIDRSTANLRTLFWAALRADDPDAAKTALAEVKALYGPTPTPAQKKFLDKMRSGGLASLTLLEGVRNCDPLAFDPVRGRLAYVLHNSLPYSSGGYATRAQGLALGLQRNGFEVIALSRPGFPRDINRDLLKVTLPAEDMIEGVRYLRSFEPFRQEITPPYAVGAAVAIEAQLREFRPELVIAASAHLSALPALIAARRLGLPFIYEVRGFWEVTRISRNPALEQSASFKMERRLEAEIGRHADHVFTLTGPMREELVERGVPAEKITLLPNSCDPSRFTPRPRDAELAARLGIPADVPVIGYIGTFVQYEGLDDLARAAALLRRRGLVFRLLLVGNENTSGTERGPITTEIERVAAEEGLADWLILPGRVPHSEVEAYYSLIDVAPFPRKPQPVTEMVSPMKPLEALAMEKAVVVSSVRALTEMVADGETGLVFAKGDVESLADVLARLIGDPGLRARLGRAGRDWVERERTWTATAARAKAEIDRVLAPVTAPPPTPKIPVPAAEPIPAKPTSKPAAAKSAAKPKPKPAAPPPPVLPPLAPEREKIFTTVHGIYAERDKLRKKPAFSENDWARTRLAFDMLEGVERVADIGIGQAQLVNLLARTPEVRRVVGYDFRNYGARINPPRNDRYDFRVWDITGPLDPAPEPADVVVAMEVLEHIAVDRFDDVLGRLRALAPDRAIFVTVPYKERHPLYHHDQPHGHQQSFDDAKIEALFGPGCLYSDYRKKWYFVFAHDRLVRPEALGLTEFCTRVRALLAQTTPAAPEQRVFKAAHE